jgi:hypothetical protein
VSEDRHFHALRLLQANPPASAGAELAAIGRIVEKLKADPQALQRVMQRAGIVTGNGKLTEEFGG